MNSSGRTSRSHRQSANAFRMQLKFCSGLLQITEYCRKPIFILKNLLIGFGIPAFRPNGYNGKPGYSIYLPDCGLQTEKEILPFFRREPASLQNFFKYATSEVIRFAFLLTDESLTSLAKKVPDLLDYSDRNGVIDYNGNIDFQLYNLFRIDKKNQLHIKKHLIAKTH